MGAWITATNNEYYIGVSSLQQHNSQSSSPVMYTRWFARGDTNISKLEGPMYEIILLRIRYRLETVLWLARSGPNADVLFVLLVSARPAFPKIAS